MVVLSIHLHILLPPTVERSECHEITDVRDLTHALKNISDWKTLGYELGVPEVIIESIEIDERGAENKRRALLRKWYNLQHHNPCWQFVTDALMHIGQNHLATKIEQCIECIKSWTDCNLDICLKNGVDKCSCSHSISADGGSIGLMTVLAVIVLICLYFSYRLVRQG